MIKIEDLRNIKDLSVVEGLEIKTYVPIMIKMAMIDALVGDLVQQDEYGMYVVNSMIKEVKSKMAIVALYTNIELTDDDYLNYDVMNADDAFNKIIYIINEGGAFSPSDVQEFYRLLDERIADKLAQNSMEHVMALRTKEFMTAIEKTMSHVDSMLDKGDPNIIAKHLSKGVEAIAKKLPDFSKFDLETYLNQKIKV